MYRYDHEGRNKKSEHAIYRQLGSWSRYKYLLWSYSTVQTTVYKFIVGKKDYERCLCFDHDFSAYANSCYSSLHGYNKQKIVKFTASLAFYNGLLQITFTCASFCSREDTRCFPDPGCRCIVSMNLYFL